MKRETVRSDTSRPSFKSSPWIRGAPQRGFAAAMRVTKTLISALTDGRPPVGRTESLVQYSRKRRRCHTQDGVWSHDHERPPPSGPDSGKHDPEEPISSA